MYATSVLKARLLPKPVDDGPPVVPCLGWVSGWVGGWSGSLAFERGAVS